METMIATRTEFLQRYWNYYLILEKDFLETERYLAIDELNFSAFSNEYIKQYQAICSEIDVISKSYCKALNSQFRGKNINGYCKQIIDSVADFPTRTINVLNRDLQVIPWDNWSYSVTAQSNGTQKIEADNPDWWNKYNKIKHTRTTTNAETGLPYYKLANQKNVLNSLAALFQLEMHYYRLLWQTHFSNEPDMPDPSSNLFEVKDWGNTWVMAGRNIGFQVSE